MRFYQFWGLAFFIVGALASAPIAHAHDEIDAQLDVIDKDAELKAQSEVKPEKHGELITVKESPVQSDEPAKKPDEQKTSNEIKNTEKLYEADDGQTASSQRNPVETGKYMDLAPEARSRGEEEEMKRIEKAIDTKKVLKQVNEKPKTPHKSKKELEAEHRETLKQQEAIRHALAHSKPVKIEFTESEAKSSKERAKDKGRKPTSVENTPPPAELAKARHDARVEQSLENEPE